MSDETGLPPERPAEEPAEPMDGAPAPAPPSVPQPVTVPVAAAPATPSGDEDDEYDEDDVEPEDEEPPAAQAVTGALPEPSRPATRGRPDLADRREPLYRECRGYRLRLDPPDLQRLRELPGSRGRSDTEIGEAFFDGQADRLAASIADDVPAPSELRVVVDPYSRQAFLALENRIRGILSF
jgi:hypothetical protein